MQKVLFEPDDIKDGVAPTSKQCYKELVDEGVLAGRYREYLDALWSKQMPCTDQEITFALGKSDPNYVRPRRFELENEYGLIMECPPRCCGVSGRMAKTFWFTSTGLGLVSP